MNSHPASLARRVAWAKASIRASISASVISLGRGKLSANGIADGATADKLKESALVQAPTPHILVTNLPPVGQPPSSTETVGPALSGLPLMSFWRKAAYVVPFLPAWPNWIPIVAP